MKEKLILSQLSRELNLNLAGLEEYSSLLRLGPEATDISGALTLILAPN